MNKILAIVTLLITLSSCEKALNIELPSIESKLVINSYMITDEYWDAQSQFLLVSNSIEGMGTLDDFIYTDSIPVISYADAVINEINNENNTIINQYPLEFTNKCYCYTNPSFTPEENKTYQLNVEVSNYPTITSIETMPSKPTYSITDFEIKAEIDESSEEALCDFNIVLKDTPNQKNYYQLKIMMVNTFSSKEKSCIYEVHDPAFLIPINRYNSSNTYYKGRNGYFSDELFEGEEKSLFIEVKKPEGIYDHFYIEVTSYSENLYQFNLTRREQNRDSNNFIFNSEAIFIDSNIDGGYGVFGGRARSRRAYIPTFYPTSGLIEY
ncbi:MAG: hypothetical protein CMP62_04805 [Flavobacteriales bacterium]|nr:hypothetical protein [Flavobacteriales bacterium]|tara:strand:+ start:2226 stop:3200 length:975 start_codon:yes stop_codon:yes gene_type:complete